MLRTGFRAFVTLQTLLLGAVVIAAGIALTPGIALLPQAVAGLALALGLLSVYPVATNALGARQVYGWLARSRLAREGIEAHRPFQFAAVLSALASSAAIRLPGWLSVGVPRALEQFRLDVASDGLAPTLWAWLVVTALSGGLLALVLAFSALVVHEALFPGKRTEVRSTAANATVLWNVLSAVVLASAELPGLFGEHDDGPRDWRWWVALLLAVALTRRVLVVSLLFAYDRFEIPLDATLAARVLPVQISTKLTALGLASACALHLALEPHLGVAASAAVIVVVSGPAAWLLEQAGRGRECVD